MQASDWRVFLLISRKVQLGALTTTVEDTRLFFSQFDLVPYQVQAPFPKHGAFTLHNTNDLYLVWSSGLRQCVKLNDCVKTAVDLPSAPVHYAEELN